MPEWVRDRLIPVTADASDVESQGGIVLTGSTKSTPCCVPGDLMNTLKLKPVTASVTMCALSLALSAAAFAAGGTRTGGSSGTANATRMSTPTRVSEPARSIPARSMPIKPAAASAKTTTHTTGQPNASCETTPNTPGNSASAPGSAFNPDGKAGTVYAGEQPQNSRNPKSVSQYDVACTRPVH